MSHGQRTPAVAKLPTENASSRFPNTLTHLVGREEALLTLIRQTQKHRLVTVCGPGGVGKSALTAAAVSRLSETYGDGVYLVHLASVRRGQSVAARIAGAVGLPTPAGEPEEAVISFLRPKQALLVLDDCEHLVNEIAPLVESLLRAAPGLTIITTSREPLRAEGECLHRLHPLRYPAADESLKASEVRRYPAVQMFIERVLNRGQELSLSDTDVECVAEICRLADGVPLAIELAASRAGLLGLEQLVARLREQPLLSGNARRTAADRHQTLSASLEWSYALLSDRERTVLERLASLKDAFTVESAVAWVSRDGVDPQEVVECLFALVEKSLIAMEMDGSGARYRLINITRRFVLEKLSRCRESEECPRWQMQSQLKRAMYIVSALGVTRDLASFAICLALGVGALVLIYWARLHQMRTKMEQRGLS